jgi:anaerobic magnesium-protoporphyrin IX monomethyl ester cyclase
MRVALVNARLNSAVCDYGVGHQMPLGLLMIGGSLQGRCVVTLIDAARDHLSEDEIVRRVAAFGADVAMVSRVGSTRSHPCRLRTQAAPRSAMPRIVTV